MIPATSSEPGNLYWQARTMMDGTELRYQSPPNGRGDAVVVVWPDRLTSDTQRVVVEGPFDALAAAHHGAVGIALMGAAPPDVVWDHIARLCKGYPILVVGDRDTPGVVVDWLTKLANYGLVARARMPYPYKDLAEMDREAREELLR